MQTPLDPAHSDGGQEYVVCAEAVSKGYTLYNRSSQRLMHLLMPWRAYPQFEALKGVSFKVARGETVGIIGQNGAGKSTLLQIVTGTVPPTAGDIFVGGRVAALLELGAGFEPDFTGRENILLNGTILGLSERKLKERMNDIIAFSELGEFVDRPVRTYSSGMFMRLAFSVAAHVDADLLIIDEALSVGDARFNQKCMRFLKRFKKTGSILFVSHDVGAVTGLCDRAIWLDHGSVRAEGNAIQVCEQYVSSLFGDSSAGTNSKNESTGALQEASEQNAPLSDQLVLYQNSSPPLESKPGITSCSEFNPKADAFGSGGARIVDTGVYDPDQNTRLSQVSDGQTVNLRVVVDADERVNKPIFGFYIKDRLGQLLLGENTYWEDCPQPSIAPGERISAQFQFKWPALAKGNYSLTVAIADGTMADHDQRHWLHDAMIFEVLSSAARHGLVGLDMHCVTIDRESSDEIT